MNGIKRRSAMAAVVGLATVFVAAGGALAQQADPEIQREMEGLAASVSGPLDDPALETRATRLASDLRCPVCQGLAIQDSPSPLAQQMKDLIRSQVASGWSDADVVDYFVSKYGEWVLLEPRPAGFNLLVYVLPVLLLLGGGVLIFVAVRRWTAPAPEQAASRS